MTVTFESRFEIGNDSLITRVHNIVDNQPRLVKIADHEERRVFASFSITGLTTEDVVILAGPSGEAQIATYRGIFGGSTGNFEFDIDSHLDIIKEEFWALGQTREIVTFIETLCICGDMFEERKRYY